MVDERQPPAPSSLRWCAQCKLYGPCEKRPCFLGDPPESCAVKNEPRLKCRWPLCSCATDAPSENAPSGTGWQEDWRKATVVENIDNIIALHALTLSVADMRELRDAIVCIRQQQAALAKVDALIAHQYTGSQEAMNALQDAADDASSVLSKWKLP